MINLIPPEGYHMIKKEYLLRVGAVYCFLITGVCVLLTVAMVPMYVLLDAQIKEVESEVREGNSTNSAVKNTENEVSIIKNVLAQLKVEEKSFRISTAIDEIQKSSSSEISFKTFYIDGAKGEIKTIQVQGTATTREKLIQFKKKLEESELFESVEIPIADLARDANLPFAITIRLSK